MKPSVRSLTLLAFAAVTGPLAVSAEESSATDASPNPSTSILDAASAESLPRTPVSAPPGMIRLAGANGREVDFAGIWEARPEGLVVLINAEAPVATVAWDRFDLERLRNDHPSIDAARQRAIFLRSPQPINLGLFAGLLTPAQAGSELRRMLDEAITVKVPVRYRTVTTSTGTTRVGAVYPTVYNGLTINPQPYVTQSSKVVTETRVSPEEITTSSRRILAILSRTDGGAAQDRRDVFELIKSNPALVENIAQSLERISASLPPRHLLPNDPTVLTLAIRLREFSDKLRELSSAVSIDHADQMMMRDILYLADSPNLR